MSHHIQVPAQNCFVMSDIHGQHELLQRLLDDVRHDEKIIFIGDYCDRGRDSYDVLKTVKSLVESGKAYASRGNHDQMFLDFLAEPEEQAFFYYNQGGRETVESFFRHENNGFSVTMRFTPQKLASEILLHHKDLVDFLMNLPYSIEMDDWLFVHAGVKPYSTEWKKTTSLNDFLWIRQEFYLQKNETGKRVMFGHTSAHHLPVHTTPIWTNRQGNIFGIDGGAGGSGCLNGIRLRDNNIQEVIKAKKDGDVLTLPFENYQKGEMPHGS